jgi:hypothetical protein
LILDTDEGPEVQRLDSPTNLLLDSVNRTQNLVRGLFLEDTPRRRLEWGEKLYRAATRISLTPAQYEMIESHYEALQEIIDAATDPVLSGAHIFVQGSVRSRTAILPQPGAKGEHSDVDADAVVWLPYASQVAVDTFNALERRLREGSRTQRPPTRKNRCVRLHYKDDSPKFHMDVTPARNAAGNSGSKGEGALLVPDLKSGSWKPSAPVDFADWFADKCDSSLILAADEQRSLEEREKPFAKSTQEPLPDHEAYIDFNPLRAAIKLLKAHRDIMFLDESVCDLRPISIVITTLAARAYEQIARESVVAPRRSADALIEIVDRMPQFIAGPPGARVVCNPVITTENFAEKWRGPDGAALEAAFYDWHREAQAALKLGLWRFASQETLTEALEKSFGARAAGHRLGTTALPLTPIIRTRSARAPKEQFIAEMFPVALSHQLKIDCEVRNSGSLIGKLRNKSRTNRWLPYGRQLRFFVSSCNVPVPYDLFWKVRNVGPAATRKGQERGEIVRDAGRQWKDERTSFSGEHYVEAYVIKNGVCMAQDRIQVPIESQ